MRYRTIYEKRSVLLPHSTPRTRRGITCPTQLGKALYANEK